MFKVNLQLTQKLTSYFTPCSSDSIVNFEHVIAGWVRSTMKDDRLSALNMMNIQANVLHMIEFDYILNNFLD